MAEAVVDQLEVVDVEEEHGHGGAGGLRPAQPLLQPLDEQLAVGEAGERVVGGAVAQGLLGAAALERGGEHVRDRLQEVDVLDREAPGLRRVHLQRADPPGARLDRRRDGAAHAELGERVRQLEARLREPVVDGLGGAGADDVGDVARRAGGRRGALVERERGGPQREVAVRLALPDTRVLDPRALDERLDRRRHQSARVLPLEGALPEARDDRLLVGDALEVLLDALALGDVVHHPVPDRHAVGVALELRVLEDPDHAPVAGQHPVLRGHRRGRVEVALVLERERVLAVVGVDLAGPERRVGHPLLGGEAEDLLDLVAYEAPAAVLAELGRVEDRRDALDEAAQRLLIGL